MEFCKFGLIGASGLAVDMSFLFLLTDPRFFGLSIVLSKLCAAEVALINNFIWNELWTFRRFQKEAARPIDVFRRLLLFNAICGVGIGFAVFLLQLLHDWLHWPLYLSNLLAIGIVTLWNFSLNARYNWMAWKVNRMPSSGQKVRRSLIP
jgi:dolichol-phosphate mannosyltransferase